jgi:predicted neuraminidase
MRPAVWTLLAAATGLAGNPLFEQQLIFPPGTLHSHASSIVELDGGRLMACWYLGSGERTADDVKIQAAYLDPGAPGWTAPFTLADTPGFPDTNPVMFVDRADRLWLVWTAILDNRWESALLKLRIAPPHWAGRDVPRWEISDNILLIPENLKEKTAPLLAGLSAKLPPGGDRTEAETAIKRLDEKLYNRLGWMPRIHPLELPGGRVLLPLYSDTYNLSLIAITADGGRTWHASDPLVSLGGVQPSLVLRKDGTLAAFMRDNGPPPKRVLVGESRDGGETWGRIMDSEIPNPGSSLEVIALRNGLWCMVHNDTGKGRQRLSVWLSDDEGKTWRWKRLLEDNAEGGFSYPSLIEARDGTLHVTYSHSLKSGPLKGQAIKHVHFNTEWVKAGQ